MAQVLESDAVAAQVHPLLSPQLRPLATALTHTVVRRHPHGLPSDPAIRAAVIAQGVDLIARRAPGALALRVYDPNGSGGSMIAVVVDDAPFLLSTIAGALERMQIGIANQAYPEFGVVRDASGAVCDLQPARDADERQTWIHIELRQRLDSAARQRVADVLRDVLGDAQRVTSDFAAMRGRAGQIAEQLRKPGRDGETVALLRWLLDDHFVFLGAADYQPTNGGVEMVVASALGVLRQATANDVPKSLPASLLNRDAPPLTVSLTHQRSTVHRHERMLDIIALVAADDGSRLRRLVGLFAKKATAEPVATIPLLRRWVEQVTSSRDIVANSHDERMLRSALEALPKDALFTADPQCFTDLFDTLVQERGTIRVTGWTHAPSAAAIIIVALPQDRFDAQLRERVDALVAHRLGTEITEPFVGFHEDEALLTYVLPIDAGAAFQADPQLSATTSELQTEVAALSQTWRERLLAAAPAFGAQQAARQWVDRLPAAYRESISPLEAVTDCRELAALADGDADVRMRVMFADRTALGGVTSQLRFKLYRRGPAVELSRFVPILESLGLVVVESMPTVLHDAASAAAERTGPEFRIHDYGVRLRVEADFHVDDDGSRLAAAAQAIWAGHAEADSLNRLVLLAGLHWRDVAVLRAYRQFRRQIGTTFSAQFQNDTLCAYPEIARALMEYFVARFRPGIPDQAARVADARAWLLEKLEEVSRLDQDRILRGYLDLIAATVRTNRYRAPRPYQLALKFASALLPGLPKPVPFREIFVYSPHAEGIHLRGGPVARGGLRWSDRQEDFRVEVADLMKAQMVKNAVIVPTGSKGGFVLKRETRPDALRDEIRVQYESFIRGLLDVTDNIVDGQVRHPEGVRLHDQADPYLVVAADRGTAALSDVANAISMEYGFWLGDAFASGGSHGYDHKAMGITARGAWVAVQQHFRELDIDVQAEPITVVGIGDMSGDVFGNAMLRSRAIKLVAAFDHRDIIIDPDPDPASSFTERQRLFQTPSSTWQDYDRERLSAGGGVWSRAVKSIQLTPQIRRLVRSDHETLTPPELIQALLHAPVDLLFAGGIGTFVKASTETDAAVGDRANDAIRVAADELGARVVGEGGNLAVTQRGRVQYARRGGRINMDAIDNAAGVDTSDREVNLKILLAQAIDAGQLESGERDAVLAEVTADVATRVLDDVRAQVRLLSKELLSSAAELTSYEQLMADLEASGRLDRVVDALPDGDEMERRGAAGGGLTRPELGLLNSYAKADLSARLETSRLPAQAALRPLLEGYFPAAISERFGPLLDTHRLHDELVATLLANDLVNHLGITAVSRTVHQLGCGAAQVAGAYWVAREVSGAAADWDLIDALGDRLEPALQFQLEQPIDRLVETYTRLYASRGLEADLRQQIARDRAAFVLLEEVWPSDPPPNVALQRRDLITAVTERGVDKATAVRLVAKPDLAIIPDVAEVASDRGRPVEQVAAAFVQIGRELPLAQLTDIIERIVPDGRWQQWEQKTLLDELHGIRRLAARQALDAYPELGGEQAVSRLLHDRTAQLERVWTLLAAISADDEPALPQASVTMSALRGVLD